jgi:hypothetical protein
LLVVCVLGPAPEPPGWGARVRDTLGREMLEARSTLTERQQAGLAIFGLGAEFEGPRWISQGGAGHVVLAHGNPRPDPGPLVEVGVIPKRRSENSWVDVHDWMGRTLIVAERSRNDPAFQFETRDQAIIDRELASVPGPAAWQPATLEINGAPCRVQRVERNGDWVAIYDLGEEWLHVHVQQPDSRPVTVTTITDITPYLEP